MEEESKIYYHYCSLETFYNIIKSKHIRLCNIYKMNDYKEYIYIDEIIEKVIKEVEEERKKYDIYIRNFKNQYYDFKNSYIPHVACFSKERDSIGQWRGYGDDGKGIAIGFDFSKLDLLNISSDLFNNKGYSNVNYDKCNHKKIIRKQIETYLEICKGCSKGSDIYPLVSLINTFLAKSTVFKNEGFKQEEEVRIIYLPDNQKNKDNELEKDFYIKNNEIISFYKLNFEPSKVISKIILGPKFKMKKDDADFKAYLKANKINVADKDIIYSEISYR